MNTLKDLIADVALINPYHTFYALHNTLEDVSRIDGSSVKYRNIITSEIYLDSMICAGDVVVCIAQFDEALEDVVVTTTRDVADYDVNSFTYITSF